MKGERPRWGGKESWRKGDSEREERKRDRAEQKERAIDKGRSEFEAVLSVPVSEG